MNGAVLILIFTACGAAVGLLFDFFRAFRRAAGCGQILTQTIDALFWIISGIICAYCLWRFNNGALRAFAVLSFFIGGVLYFLLISHALVRGLTFAFINIFKFMRFILKILLTPAKFLYKIITVAIDRIILITVRVHKDNGKIGS